MKVVVKYKLCKYAKKSCPDAKFEAFYVKIWKFDMSIIYLMNKNSSRFCNKEIFSIKKNFSLEVIFGNIYV